MSNITGDSRWQCGDNFANPIPSGRGGDFHPEIPTKNHWKVVFDSYLEADEKQRDLWKDEVNTLLIFAGLFSAVVTAFLVESYKLLLPQGNSAAVTFGSGSINVVRLNSLWFASLVLALSTVVIGIVGLQWLRNHQRYHGVKPREALSLIEMRTKALRAWHIRWTFLSLPLIILVALVLFFVGLFEFLLALDKKVATVVGVLVFLTIAFLVLSTVLPSLQIFKLSIRPPVVAKDDDMPTPCPYKSPQSWIFHRSLIVVVDCFQNTLALVRRLCWVAEKPIGETVTVSNLPLYLTLHANPKKWHDFDINWLRLRDTYSQTMEGNHRQTAPFDKESLRHPRRPIYDEAQIIKNTISIGPSPDVLFAVYHCFQEVSKDALYPDIQSKTDYADPKYKERNLILRGYYWKHLSVKTGNLPHGIYNKPMSQFFQDPNVHLLHDENLFVFLQMHTAHNLPDAASRLLSAHLSELQTRILAHVYAAEQASSKSSPSKERALREPLEYSPWLFMMSKQYNDMINTRALPAFKIWSHFSPSHLNGNKVPVSTDTVCNAITQYSIVFRNVVQQVAAMKSPDWTKTIHAHDKVSQFFDVPASMLRYTGTDQAPFDVFAKFNPAFTIIRDVLGNVDIRANATATQDGDRSPEDYVFLIACHFINQLFDPYAAFPVKKFTTEQCKIMANLIVVLDAYERSNNSVKRIGDNARKHWNRTGLEIAGQKQRRPNIVNEKHATGETDTHSYIHWPDIPSWILAEIHHSSPPPNGSLNLSAET